MSVDLLFFFDSEDYETPAADEGELWWAEAMTRHGLTGCFNLVGEEARALRDRGRHDILRALARHEIGYHSDLHSAHPVHVEYLEGMGWDEGIAAVLARESAGLADVRHLLGQSPAAFCKPGSNWAPQVLVAMTRLGIPAFCDAPFEWAPGHPLWYCGSLCLGAHTSFDRYFNVSDRRRTMREDFRALLDARRADGGAIVMYTHPCRLITAAFPENFTAGQNPPRSAWRPAPVRPRSQINELMEDFDDFLGWIARETDARPTTYRSMYERCFEGDRWLDRGGLAELLGMDQNVIQPRKIGGSWLSPAEQLGVLLWVAAWRREYPGLPAEVPIRPLLGPDRLASSGVAGAIAADQLFEAAGEMSYLAGRSGRVPAVSRVGQVLLGPAQLLRTLTELLYGDPLTMRLTGGDELPALARRDDFANLHFRKTWSILPPEFEAPGIVQLAQLQTWSAKPAW